MSYFLGLDLAQDSPLIIDSSLVLHVLGCVQAIIECLGKKWLRPDLFSYLAKYLSSYSANWPKTKFKMDLFIIGSW